MGDALLCQGEILAASSFGWFASSHSQAGDCAALLLTVSSHSETGTVLQATQKAHVGHLQVAEAVAVGTSGFAHPSSPTSPGKPAVHTSAPVWVTLWEGLFFAVPHLWGNLERED